MPSSARITDLLVVWSGGDQTVLDELLPLVEAELRRLARHYMRSLRPGNTLQTTALIHEAYLRLVDQSRVQWQNRAHFYGIAANMMRRVLLNYLRDQRRLKRGGGGRRVSLSDAGLVSVERSESLIALDSSLDRLAALDPRKGRVVELRFFGGLSVNETAEVMEVSRMTVIRDWNFAKAWMYRDMNGE